MISFNTTPLQLWNGKALHRPRVNNSLITKATIHIFQWILYKQWMFWVQWCKYVQELKAGMSASLDGTFQLSTWKYLHWCTNEKHSLFVYIYNIQVDLCHFDWKLQLSKQTKRRPTIFNCENYTRFFWVGLLDSTVTMWVLYSYFETRRHWMYVPCTIDYRIWPCSNTALPKTQHAMMFLLGVQYM